MLASDKMQLIDCLIIDTLTSLTAVHVVVAIYVLIISLSNARGIEHKVFLKMFTWQVISVKRDCDKHVYVKKE